MAFDPAAIPPFERWTPPDFSELERWRALEERSPSAIRSMTSAIQYTGRDFLFETLEAYERLGSTPYHETAARLDWHWQRGAFPSFRRARQRNERLDPDEARASLRRHGVLP
jgi:hypothetical protein